MSVYISVWDTQDIWTLKSNKTRIPIGCSLSGVEWGHTTVKPEVPFWLSIQLFWGELPFGSYMYLSHWKDLYCFWYQGADPPMGHCQCFFWKFQQKFQHATLTLARVGMAHTQLLSMACLWRVDYKRADETWKGHCSYQFRWIDVRVDCLAHRNLAFVQTTPCTKLWDGSTSSYLPL